MMETAMKFDKTLQVLIAAMIMLTAAWACTDNRTNIVADGDSETSEDDGRIIYFRSGGGSTDGNPSIVVVGFTNYNFLESPVRWYSLDLHISSVFMADSESCDLENGYLLSAEEGSMLYSLVDETSPKIGLEIPSGKSYCSIDIRLNENAIPFRAEGVTEDGRTVVIESHLYGQIPLLPKNGSFEWDNGQKENWLLAMDFTKILPSSLSHPIKADDYGILRIDSTHNAAVFEEISDNILKNFALLKDTNGNGLLEKEEFNENNLIASGSTERHDDKYDQPQVDCPAIAIDPTVVDFGAVQLYDTGSGKFTISNISEDDTILTIHNIFYDDMLYTPEYVLDKSNLSEFPFKLGPNESQEIRIDYTPADAGTDQARIAVISNACDESSLLYIDLESKYKGTAVLDIDPSSKDFGNVDLGDNPQREEFSICNTGDSDGNRILSIMLIQLESRHFSIVEGLPENLEDNPILLSPGRCHGITVEYSPISLSGENDPHSAEILVVYNINTPRTVRIPISGTANNYAYGLFLVPFQIDFGTVRPQQHADKDVTIHNLTAGDITIDSISIKSLDSDNCEEFSIEDLNGVPGSIIEANDASPRTITLSYSPQDNGEDTCHLEINSSLAEAGTLHFLMKGIGSTNKKPVALVSQQSHGNAIGGELSGFEDTEKCFYGDMSYDPDGVIETYTWNWLLKPNGSTAKFNQEGYNGRNVCITFDKRGKYMFELVVTDNDGIQSDSFPVTMNVSGIQGLKVRAEFSAGTPTSPLGHSEVDVDLRFYSTAYSGVCDDDHINASNDCLSLSGAECSMPVHSDGADSDGTIEEINCTGIDNGPWYVEVELKQDCSDVNDWQPIWECWGTHDSTVTLEFYDPLSVNDSEMLFDMQSTKLTFVGNKSRWLIVRSGNLWQGEPQHQ